MKGMGWEPALATRKTFGLWLPSPGSRHSDHRRSTHRVSLCFMTMSNVAWVLLTCRHRGMLSGFTTSVWVGAGRLSCTIHTWSFAGAEWSKVLKLHDAAQVVKDEVVLLILVWVRTGLVVSTRLAHASTFCGNCTSATTRNTTQPRLCAQAMCSVVLQTW
mmetsp:Transcript_21207/g.38050  ORF Transcript_21207/g.38050 Transcript_21207/m.38050 type:complete len:160 (+) Transcript_21207:479-958(+)